MAFLYCRWLEHLVLIVGLCYGRDLETDTWVRWWCDACGACWWKIAGHSADCDSTQVFLLVSVVRSTRVLLLWWGVTRVSTRADVIVCDISQHEILWLVVSKCARGTLLSTSKSSAVPLSCLWQQPMRNVWKIFRCVFSHVSSICSSVTFWATVSLLQIS